MEILKQQMKYNFTPLARGRGNIHWIVCHYVGALGGAQENANYYGNTYVGASADFFVGHAGEVIQTNDYLKGYSWHCGGGNTGKYFGSCTNSNSIGIEMCVRKRSTASMNAEDKDWYFEDATINGCAELVASKMKELNIDINHVIRHYDVNYKMCPAPFVQNESAWISFKNKALEYYNGANKPVKEDIWLDWTKYESGTAGFKQTGGDSGKAYGKYQFDYRYGLVPFMQSCVSYNPSRYSGFEPFIALGAGNARLPGNKDLTALWGKYCDKYPAEFEGLQDKAAMTDYYYPVKKYLANKGINLDNHDSAVRGSAFSMAIRSGALTAANKFSGCKDSDRDADILKRAYATYGQEDAGRWSKQLVEALAALKTATPSPDKPAGTYIVQAGSYKDKKLANSLAEVLRQRGFNTLIKQESGQYKIQCGSFSNKANADKLLSCIRQCGFDAVIKASEFTPYKIKVDAADLRVRSGAGIKYTKQAYTGKGEFTIVDEQKDASGQVWGLLKAYEMERNGWVALWLDCVDRV